MRTMPPLLKLGKFISLDPGLCLAELVRGLFHMFGFIILGILVTPGLALGGESIWHTGGHLGRLVGNSTPGHWGESGHWAACQ